MRLTAPIEGCATTLAHPLTSRRLAGAGIGIDLNPDHSCNWRCVYCDVPDLVDAKGPRVDVEVLEAEVTALLRTLRESTWLSEHAPEGLRELRGLLVSGHGEPTLSFQFQPAVEAVERVLAGTEPGLRLAVVTNGSNVNNRKVREGLERWATLGGEVWFKFDAASRETVRSISRSDSILRQIRENMRVSANLCPTWLQTVVASIDGAPALDAGEQEEYLSFLALQQRARVELRGVQLLAPDRASAQSDGAKVESPPLEWLEEFADRIRALDLAVTVYA